MAIFSKQNFCPSCMEKVRSLTAVCPLCGFNPSEAASGGRYLKPQTVIDGRYLVGCAQSENLFSVTYIGRDLKENKKKIIKEYCPFSCVSRQPSESADTALIVSEGKEAEFKNGLEVFTYNAKRLKELDHEALPGIINVTDVIEYKGTCYMICDYEEGELLRKVLKKSGDKLESKEMFALVKPIISSLTELHKNNIIHANISPYNIIVSRDRKKATLIGFALGDAGGFDVIPKSGFTPLEQYPAFKGSIGPWTDIFGLCSTIYYCITGVIPAEATDRTVDDSVESPSALGIDISSDKEAVLMQGMEVYERDRFKAVRALYNAMYSDEEEVVYLVEEPEEAPVAEPQPAENTAPAASESEAVQFRPSAPKSSDPVSDNASGEYSQVIVRRKNKDFVEIKDSRYSVKLESLDLSGMDLKDSDTKDMDRFSQMEYLILDNNSLGSIEFVSQMRKLISVSAKDNYISDISMLVNLPELREINLSGNAELTDVSVFEYIRKIRKLDISNTGVTDIKALHFLDQLRYLDLRGTKVPVKQIKQLYSEMPSCTIKYDFKK